VLAALAGAYLCEVLRVARARAVAPPAPRSRPRRPSPLCRLRPWHMLPDADRLANQAWDPLTPASRREPSIDWADVAFEDVARRIVFLLARSPSPQGLELASGVLDEGGPP